MQRISGTDDAGLPAHLPVLEMAVTRLLPQRGRTLIAAPAGALHMETALLDVSQVTVLRPRQMTHPTAGAGDGCDEATAPARAAAGGAGAKHAGIGFGLLDSFWIVFRSRCPPASAGDGCDQAAAPAGARAGSASWRCAAALPHAGALVLRVDGHRPRDTTEPAAEAAARLPRPLLCLHR